MGTDLGWFVKEWEQKGGANLDETVSINEPVDEFQPLTWDAFKGQTMLKAQLQVRVASAKTRDDKLPPTLLVASPGAGKTTLARLVAHELDRPLAAVTKPLDSNGLADRIWSAGDRPVLFVDEVHEWSKKQQHLLMQLTESGTLDLKNATHRFPGVSVILATTDPQNLFEPLVSRMMVRPDWEPYTHEDMSSIVTSMAESADIDFHLDTTPPMIPALVTASAGSPRQARMIIVAARDLVCAGITELSASLVLGFLDLEPDGLHKDHIKYLTVLAAQQKGQAGLDALGTLLGWPSQYVRSREKPLVKAGFVEYSSTGRIITGAGRKRLKQSLHRKGTR